MGEGILSEIGRFGVRVYLDENVNVHLTNALERRGYDATHVLLEGSVGLADEYHLRYATIQGRAIVTHNFADYAHLHADFAQRGEHHEGIILVPVRPLPELLARLSRHLNTCSPVQQRNNLLWA